MSRDRRPGEFGAMAGLIATFIALLILLIV